MEKSTLRLDQEDFFYQEAAVPVIKDIMRFLGGVSKPAFKSLSYVWDYPIDPDVWFDLWEDPGHALYTVNIRVSSVDFESDHPGWNIDGISGFGESAEAVIDIHVQLSPRAFRDKEIILSLETELYNVVPHEMHHLTQNDQPFQRVSCPLTSSARSMGDVRYFISSCEVPAFVIGFRGEAHSSGRPIEELINVYLNNQMKAGKINSNDVKQIKSRWLSHIVWNKEKNESSLRVVPGTTPRLDKKDRVLLALLRKHMNESILRTYVRELLTESRLSGRTIQGVLALLKGHANNTWIFFDTETTGMHPNSAQLTEIGAIAVNPNNWENDSTVLGQFNEKIKLGKDALEAIAQQNANPEDVRGKSIQDLLSMTRYGEQGREYGDEQAVLDRFFEFVASFPNPMLVAQNASFDLRFVNVRSGGNLPSSYPVLDTMQLMKLYLIPLLKTQSKAEEGDPEAQALLNKLYVRKRNWGYHSTSMGVVSKAYGISIEAWHNALADVQMMMEMYKNVVATIRRGMNVDIRDVQGRDLAYQRKRKKRR
jgi:DNA polymerase III epsilon subunit-like protein